MPDTRHAAGAADAAAATRRHAMPPGALWREVPLRRLRFSDGAIAAMPLPCHSASAARQRRPARLCC